MKNSSSRRSGGILIAMKSYLYENCKKIRTDNKACLWFLLKKNMFNVDKDILGGAIYLPPEGSRYGDIGMYDDIEKDLMLLNPRNSYYTMLAGDFNAKTVASKSALLFQCISTGGYVRFLGLAVKFAQD